METLNKQSKLFVVRKLGLSDGDLDVWHMRVRIPGARLDYEHRKVPGGSYWILMIRTNIAQRRHGLATRVLEYFFKEVVARNPGPVYPGEYTDLGIKFKPALERLALAHGVDVKDGLVDFYEQNYSGSNS